MKIYGPCPRCSGTGKIPSGAALREARRKAKKTMRDVAEGMEVSLTYISDLEGGKRNLTYDLGRKYMEAIGDERT